MRILRGGGWRVRVALLVGLCLLAAACGGGKASGGGGKQAAQEIRLGMSTSSIAVPGPWVAEVLGYYQDEGLDVKITTSAGSVATAQQAVTGQFDMVYGGVQPMLQAIDRTNTDLYPFFNVFYKVAEDWIVPADSGIHSVADVKGTTIGVSSLSGGEMPFVYYLLARNGIDAKKDVKIVAVGDEAPNVLAAFKQGRIDSMARTPVITVALRAQGFNVRSIFPQDVASHAVEGFLATKDLASNHDLLARFSRATAKGFLFCQTNVSACVDAIGKKYPDRVTDRKVAMNTIETFLPLITPPKVNGRYFFGKTELESINANIDEIKSVPDSSVKDPDALKRRMAGLVISDDKYLASVNDFDYDAVVKQAKEYKAST